ncbi:MAG: flagellar hook-associated protein FlgK [Pseudomonadota bacterium]
MTGISTALSNAVSGLSAASRRADIVAGNIANALTPGYSRRDLSVSEQVRGGAGGGVQVDGVTRSNDPVLTGQRRRAEGVSVGDEIAARTYADFNTALGEPDEPFSLFAQYANFERGLRDLAETPESAPLQNAAVDNANALITNLNDLSTRVREVREGADRAIARDITTVNNALKEIESLNLEIASASSSNADVNGLIDQRTNLIDQVSQVIPVREIVREQGRVDLITDQGVFLLNTFAREIEFTPTPTITADLTLAGGGLSGISVDGVDITPGSGILGVAGGTLGGNLRVRDEIAPQFQGRIDGLARDLIERFEGIDPTLAPGAAGLFTDAGAPLDPANESGLAGRIRLNAAVDPGQGGQVFRIRDGLGATAAGPSGNATNIRTFLDALTTARATPASLGLGGAQSAANAVAAVTTEIGSARIQAETSFAATAARTTSLRDAELETTAVDTDAELQRLIEIEQAFAANARVIQVVDELTELLLSI